MLHANVEHRNGARGYNIVQCWPSIYNAAGCGEEGCKHLVNIWYLGDTSDCQSSVKCLSEMPQGTSTLSLSRPSHEVAFVRR